MNAQPEALSLNILQDTLRKENAFPQCGIWLYELLQPALIDKETPKTNIHDTNKCFLGAKFIEPTKLNQTIPNLENPPDVLNLSIVGLGLGYIMKDVKVSVCLVQSTNQLADCYN